MSIQETYLVLNAQLHSSGCTLLVTSTTNAINLSESSVHTGRHCRPTLTTGPTMSADTIGRRCWSSGSFESCQWIASERDLLLIITFCVNHRRRKMHCDHARLCVYLCVCVCVCLSVCLTVRGRTPTLLHRPGCNLGAW